MSSNRYCRGDGIGRRTRLKIVRGNPWEFNSPPRHKMIKLILSFLIGFFISKIISGKKTGEDGIFNSLKINLNSKKYLHIHHWIWAFILSIFFYNLDFKIMFFFLGITTQGILYKDFYKFIYEK
jgi:hypothetical protein